jgi:hypothetical protein
LILLCKMEINFLNQPGRKNTPVCQTLNPVMEYERCVDNRDIIMV